VIDLRSTPDAMPSEAKVSPRGKIPPVPVALPDHELPPLPAFLDGPPFGADRHGKPIKQITGAGLIAAIRHMQDYVGQQIDEGLPGAMDPQERQQKIAQAKAASLDLLVERLNAVLPDRRYSVSRDYLLNESNYYSHEFNLFLNEFARDISGDPSFHFHRGLNSIPTALVKLVRFIVYHGEHAKNTLPPAQRHSNHRAHIVRLVIVNHPSAILVRIVNDAALAMFYHPTGKALG